MFSIITLIKVNVSWATFREKVATVEWYISNKILTLKIIDTCAIVLHVQSTMSRQCQYSIQ